MRTQRLRDPIHDMIVFDEQNYIDKAAWELLKTPDMQRLRRIKQLGVSEFIFPSATHNRFAHSVGVFHNARRLVKLIQREIKLERIDGNAFDQKRADISVLAALLHDIGHGPFSHAFEEARKAIAKDRSDNKKTNPKIEKHEDFSAKMIGDTSGKISKIISELDIDPQEIANLIGAEVPKDMYHAIISSSFDADRLDYLVRDRFMTGVGAGAIDTEWLMDNVRIASINSSPSGPDDEEDIKVYSFCFFHKARDAAEDFLLARYRLYTNVYFHKTTRGIEQMITAFFRLCAQYIDERKPILGLDNSHPLILFFQKGGETLENYRLLDDTIIWGAFRSVASNGEGMLRDLAQRIMNRDIPKCLDIQAKFPMSSDSDLRMNLKRKLKQKFHNKIGKSVFSDSANLSIYGEIGSDEDLAHKRLMILGQDGQKREITTMPNAMVQGETRAFERYYFLNEGEYKIAQDCADSIRKGK